MTAVKTEIGAETQAQSAPHAPTSSIPKSSVWDAIEYVRSVLSSSVSAHIADTSDAHDASAISVVPAGAIASTDVQAALEELDSEKAALVHTHLLAAITDAGTMAAQSANNVAITGGGITGMASPAVSSDVATKGYVDGLVAIGVRRGTVRVATTAAVAISTALNNGDTIDAVVLATGDLVLVKDQSAPAENGVYVVGAVPARSTEFDTYDEHPGALVVVQEGTASADTMWLCTSNAGGTLNTTAIAFSAFSVAGALLAANNLSDVANAATAFGAIKQAATDTATGAVELATTVEALTGTDTARAVTPAGLAAATVMQGKHTLWVPAAAMIPRITNGPSVGRVEMSSNKNMFATLDYDTTTQEFAQFEVHFPKSWNLGTVTFQPVWSHAATTTNFGVVWSLAGVARSDDDAGDVAFGAAQTSTDTGGTTNDIYIGPESSAITIAGTPAAGDTVQFEVRRVPGDGSDTMAIDARLHGIRVFYTVSAATDA